MWKAGQPLSLKRVLCLQATLRPQVQYQGQGVAFVCTWAFSVCLKPVPCARVTVYEVTAVALKRSVLGAQ